MTEKEQTNGKDENEETVCACVIRVSKVRRTNSMRNEVKQESLNSEPIKGLQNKVKKSEELRAEYFEAYINEKIRISKVKRSEKCDEKRNNKLTVQVKTEAFSMHQNKKRVTPQSMYNTLEHTEKIILYSDMSFTHLTLYRIMYSIEDTY